MNNLITRAWLEQTTMDEAEGTTLLHMSAVTVQDLGQEQLSYI